MEKFVIIWNTPTTTIASYYAGRNKYTDDLNSAKVFDTMTEAKTQLLKIHAKAGKPENYHIEKISVNK